MIRLWFLVCLVACGGKSADRPDAGPSGDAGIEPPPYRCDFADCEDGFARTCDNDPQTLDCSSFGAQCGAFTDTESGVPFNWCSCGELEESEGFCAGGRYGVVCLGGLGGLSDCGAGFVCAERPAGPFGIGCDCNNQADGICPSQSCGADPDCATCTPDCAGRSCGDNGCGGECGTCEIGDSCNASGRCESVCVPDCAGKQCGDDGCGGTCGQCEGTCSAAGQCQGTCVPSCTGKTCGDDGCGGSCGTCASDLDCNLEGACDCPFFATLTYNFTLAAQGGFPASFNFVGVNVRHIAIDGTEEIDGEFLGFGPNNGVVFVKRVRGCRPKIKVKREYALSGETCVIEETFTGRVDFVVPAPIVNADGSCTAPPM
jgi:hypothetical protein